jgi:hydroxymethylbilane synthase
VKRLRLATRGSALALVQSRSAAAALEAAHPGLAVELVVLKSEGDRRQDAPLSQAGGQGLFTRVLEEALLKGEADLAVHSLKDLPSSLAEGLVLAAVGTREDWRDAWLSSGAALPWDLADGALVGTGSPRRRAQLALRHRGLRFAELRGNVDTRLKKIAAKEVDGAVLALAGLKRLGLAAQARHIFTEAEMLPAPGQGFIALETLAQGEARGLCAAFNDPRAEAEAVCERAFLERLQSGCMAPVGALARGDGQGLSLDVFVAIKPGRPLRTRMDGELVQARGLGLALADEVLAAGL